MVGTSCQHNAALSGFLQVLQDFFAFLLYILPGVVKLCPACGSRCPYFSRGQFPEFLQQGFRHGIQVAEGHEGIAQFCLAAADFFHIVLDILGIGGDNGAVVMVICPIYLVSLIEQGGIEYKIHIFPNQPYHMSMCKLGGITFGFTGNGLDAKLVNLAGGTGGEQDAVAQSGKKGMPERVIFVHIQHPGNPHHPSGGIVRLQGGVGEQAFLLIFIQIGHVMGIFLAADASLTAVAGDVLTAARKFIDGKPAAVGAAAAFCHTGLVLQGADFLIREHGGLISGFVALPCDEGCSEGAHDTGDIRTDCLTSGDFLEASEYCVIVEGTALDYNLSAELGGIGNLDYLEQCILDDGVSQAGGYIGYACAFLLGLFHTGIHEHGTACAQVDGMLCEDGGIRKIFHAVIQGFCKSFNKGAASGGTGLVQEHAVHGLVLNLDALHILAADIQDTVHLGVEESGCIVMGHGLHLPVIQEEGGLHQGFAVTCGAGADDMHVFGKLTVDFLQGADGGFHGAAVII